MSVFAGLGIQQFTGLSKKLIHSKGYLFRETQSTWFVNKLGIRIRAAISSQRIHEVKYVQILQEAVIYLLGGFGCHLIM